jgi:hypothetical protein
MEDSIRKLLDQDYSPVAIAMKLGGPVGSSGYYKVLKLAGGLQIGCPNCGQLCFGTGNCDCIET